MQDLLTAAYQGVVRITYNHYRTGEELTNDFTLLMDWSVQQRSESAVLAFFDVVDRRWQSIDTTTIKSWELIKKGPHYK